MKDKIVQTSPQTKNKEIKLSKSILVCHFIQTAAFQNCSIVLCHTMIDLDGYPDAIPIYSGSVAQLPAKFKSRKVESWQTRGDTLCLYINELTEEEYLALLYSGRTSNS